jgi:hypothetical protein
MIPAVYSNEMEYLETKAELLERLAAIRLLIAALYLQIGVIAAGQPTLEYMLNDGHTTIKRVYRSTTEIINMITFLMTEENRIKRRLRGGGITRMVDGKNMTGNRGNVI